MFVKTDNLFGNMTQNKIIKTLIVKIITFVPWGIVRVHTNTNLCLSSVEVIIL